MREILFRGKSTDINKWVYGFYAGENCEYPWSPMIKQANIIQQGSGLWYEVAPKTVGQYTGLTDKNGVKIFEGDIIKVDDDYDTFGKMAGEIREVYFKDGGFRLKPKYASSIARGDRGCWIEDGADFEVIGNVWDNPGLLGGDINDEP
jgi:uncharacterized phage protein (TIGR01671 family)